MATALRVLAGPTKGPAYALIDHAWEWFEPGEYDPRTRARLLKDLLTPMMGGTAARTVESALDLAAYYADTGTPFGSGKWRIEDKVKGLLPTPESGNVWEKISAGLSYAILQAVGVPPWNVTTPERKRLYERKKKQLASTLRTAYVKGLSQQLGTPMSKERRKIVERKKKRAQQLVKLLVNMMERDANRFWKSLKVVDSGAYLEQSRLP